MRYPNSLPDHFSYRGVLLQFASILTNCVCVLLNKLDMQERSFLESSFVFYTYLAVFSFLFVTYKKIKITEFNYEQLKILMILSILTTLGVVSMFCAISYLHPAMYSMLSRLIIIFSIIMSYLVLKERFIREELFLIIFSILGMFVFLYGNYKDSNVYIIGVIAVILNSLFFATSNILIKKNSAVLKYQHAIPYINIMTFLFLLIFNLVCDFYIYEKTEFVFRPSVYLAISAIMLFLSSYLFFKSAEYLTYKQSNAIRTISPITLYLISMPFFVFQLNLYHIVGILICIFSTGWMLTVKSH